MSLSHVFVYGTLRTGEANFDRFLASSARLGEARTAAHFTMLDMGGFPGLVPGATSIVGEVFLVNDETLARLDRLEGHPTFYRRELLELESGPRLTAFGYVLANAARYVSIYSEIPGGDWKGRQR